MSLDFEGNLPVIIQIVALILLTIGVYPYRIRTKNRNLIMHGFLSIIAVALNLITVFWVMIPIFSAELGVLAEMTLSQILTVFLHTGLGVAALVLGFIIIFSWISHPLGELGCAKTWRLMLPTILVWAAALVLGLIVHYVEII